MAYIQIKRILNTFLCLVNNQRVIQNLITRYSNNTLFFF